MPEYKYLGAESGKQSGGRGRWNTLLERIHGKVKAARNMLLYECGGSDGIRPRTSRLQWQSKVRHVGEYACELWEGEISENWSDKLESVQDSYCVVALAAWPPSRCWCSCGDVLVEWRMRRKSPKLRCVGAYVPDAWRATCVFALSTPTRRAGAWWCKILSSPVCV